MPSIKPGRWSVNLADVDPAYLDLWRGLVALVPLLEGSGPPRDVVRHLGASDATGIWTPTGLGYGYTTDQGTTNNLEFASSTDLALSGDQIFSILVVVDVVSIPTFSKGLVAHRSAFADGLWQLYSEEGVGIRWGFHNGSLQTVAWATVLQTGQNVLLLTRRTGGEYELWVNGVSLGIQNDAGTFNLVANGLAIGNLQTDTSNGLPGDYQLFAMWKGRSLSGADARLIQQDPFGLIRPALFIDAALTVTLFATADGTITDVVNEADASSPLWSSIDDDPASPTDTDWINNAIDPGTVSNFVDVTDVPADFGNADTATMIVRFRGQNWGGGTRTLLTQIFQSNESTTMSDEITVAVVTTNGAFDNTASLTFTGLDTASGKSVWDAARLRFRWT